MAGESRGAAATPRRIQTFQFAKPEGMSAPRAEIELCGNEHMRGAGHVIRAGESNGLHYESGVDEVWMVLAGRARFCGPGPVLIGEFAVGDGILIPQNTRYSIDNIGDGDLELLQIAAFHRGAGDHRVDLSGGKDATDTVERHSGRAL